ncbi:hypothetical protein MML48_1g04818 [Holotrichia oblita]|uniref:Uncharacterized protein n=1 Tax=Holotrichia oblita TaxID=644536 RepID=A0ACB9TSU6_HOLOL|nr:hypothetical protein MML48_1g04818 [Holotrichia oblita]
MFTNTIHGQNEEMKLDAMQRVWHLNRRQSSSLSVFEESPELDLFPLTQDVFEPKTTKEVAKPGLTLDASELNDLPANYTIRPIDSHQFPVIGVYVDKRVIPGFKYRIRPLPGFNDANRYKRCLFGGRALVLKSIGRGYSRRFTFEADKDCLNNNENYFWSDNSPEGYAFELEAISEGDKFTIFDVVNREAQGTVEIMKVEGNQIEIGAAVTKEGIEKKVKVKLTAKVEFYEIGVAKLMPISGVVVWVKRKGQQNAEITKVVNVNIKHHRYYLTPGFQKGYRRVTVRGVDIGDVPTKYTMTGLEPYEIPVVGTYVDPRILPGFYYRVRPNHRKQHLFQGQSLKLASIGMGYAKRLTFESESKLNATNYLWSDNHPDGLGLEPRAVLEGTKFQILAGDQIIGQANVFRADMPQQEESTEKEMTPTGKCAIIKRIYIDVMCHINLDLNDTGANIEQLIRVCGVATVRKDPNQSEAKVIRVDNIGLDSQLNLLFARTQTELIFIPLR